MHRTLKNHKHNRSENPRAKMSDRYTSYREFSDFASMDDPGKVYNSLHLDARIEDRRYGESV